MRARASDGVGHLLMAFAIVPDTCGSGVASMRMPVLAVGYEFVDAPTDGRIGTQPSCCALGDHQGSALPARRHQKDIRPTDGLDRSLLRRPAGAPRRRGSFRRSVHDKVASRGFPADRRASKGTRRKPAIRRTPQRDGRSPSADRAGPYTDPKHRPWFDAPDRQHLGEHLGRTEKLAPLGDGEDLFIGTPKLCR